MQAVEADAFDTSISVRIATEETASAISIDDIEVTADDGNVTTPSRRTASPSGELRPVDRRSDRGGVPRGDRVAPGDRQGLGHRLALAPQKAYAAYDTPDTMATLPDVQFDNMDLDSLSIGEIFWYSANIMYYGEAGFNTDLRSYMCIPLPAVLRRRRARLAQQRRRIMAGGNVYGNEDLYYHFTGELRRRLQRHRHLRAASRHDRRCRHGRPGPYHRLRPQRGLWSSHGWNEQLSLYCAHIDVTGGGNGAPGTRPTFARVLAKGDDYVVLAFLTSEVYTQTGFSAYKFKVQSKGDLGCRNPPATRRSPTATPATRSRARPSTSMIPATRT